MRQRKISHRRWILIWRNRNKKQWKGLLFLIPSLLGTGGFVFLPFLDVIRRSFFRASGTGFVGLENYEAVLGNEALYCAMKDSYDLILLDRMLPELDGLLLLQSARADGVTIPVLMLTALSQVGDRGEGLDAGADDYLAKPFRIAELRARVNAHLRRQNRAPARRILRGVVTFDIEAADAICKSK